MAKFNVASKLCSVVCGARAPGGGRETKFPPRERLWEPYSHPSIEGPPHISPHDLLVGTPQIMPL